MNEDVSISLHGAKRVGLPLLDLWHTPSLSTEDLRAYWRFRQLFMGLKPHIDPEEDWARFAKWMKNANISWLKRAPDGHLIAVISYKIEHRVHEGRPVTLLWPEYGYSLPEARKSAGLILATLFSTGLCLFRHPRTPLYMVGTSYLSGFTALAHAFKTAWLQDEPSMTPWEQSLWRTLAEATRGYDPVHKIVNMGTIPRNPRTFPPKNPRVQAAWQHYLAHNPKWTEGYTCFVMCPADLSLLPKMARWFGDWSQRKRQERH